MNLKALYRRHISQGGTIFVASMLLLSCAAQEHPGLLRAQMNLQRAKSDTDLQAYSPVLVSEAETLYHQAAREWRNDGDPAEVDHLIYLSERKLQIAEAEASRRNSHEVAAEQRDRARNAATKLSQQHRYTQAQAHTSAVLAEQYKNLAQENQKLVRELRGDIAAIEARETQRGLELTLMNDVLFDTGQAVLKPGAVQRLRTIVTFLRDHPERTVTIEGHTDNRGDKNYNQRLSQQRADAVSQVLLSEGILPHQVISKGFGPDYPVASNATDAGRQQNRRVQLVISKQA